MFDVKVQSVSTVNVRGKQKRFGGRRGRQGDWKKAYVTLAPGSEINLLAGE
jgi:large subunit ribosomal protein L23